MPKNIEGEEIDCCQGSSSVHPISVEIKSVLPKKLRPPVVSQTGLTSTQQIGLWLVTNGLLTLQDNPNRTPQARP